MVEIIMRIYKISNKEEEEKVIWIMDREEGEEGDKDDKWIFKLLKSFLSMNIYISEMS